MSGERKGKKEQERMEDVAEAAGKVDEVGSNVTEFNKGDNIAYASVPLGAYAQKRIIPAKIAIKVPEGISHEIAATLITKGLTTNYLITKTYPLKAGETVLFHAAAGGVGQIFAQWANSIGAKVIGTVGSDEKIKVAEENGYSHVINYSKDDPRTDSKSSKGTKDLSDGLETRNHSAHINFDPIQQLDLIKRHICTPLHNQKDFQMW